MSSAPTRRAFLQTSAAAALAAPGAVASGANERLNVGLIGCGNRGTAPVREVMKLRHNVVAVADVARFRLDKIADEVQRGGQQAPKQFHDFRKLLDHPGLDAVVIATPDHHHRDQLLATMQAEKHAYCEKPLSRTIEEGKEMVEAVKKAKRVVQVGNQRHSGEHWRRCRSVIESDDFGDLVWVKVWDTRNWVKRDPFAVPDWFGDDEARGVDWNAFLGKAPRRPFDPVRYWSWRWFWDYAGGMMTDIGAHQLDIVQWLGGEPAPRSVVANGGIYHFKHWETPDVIHGVWDYGRFVATFAVEFVNGHDGVGATFYGTKMTLTANAAAGGEVKVYDTADPVRADQKPVDSWKVENETPAHVKNWLDCCKSGKEPNAPVDLGHRVVTAAHLANLSYRTGKKVYWDAENEQVIGS